MSLGRERGVVVAVSRSPAHGFSKRPQPAITLLAGLGVDGDAHAGRTVQHLYRMRRDASAPNRAQVHFLHAELLDDMRTEGFAITPGAMGENILTRGLDLLGMPTGAIFRIGTAIVAISGIRDPCKQINAIGKGLTKRLIERRADGRVIRKAGIMGVVVAGGTIKPGDAIAVALPPEPHAPLEVV